MTLLTFEVQIVKKIISVIRPVGMLLHPLKIVICLFYSLTHIYSMNYVLQNAK